MLTRALKNFKDLCLRFSQRLFKVFKGPEKYFEESPKNFKRISQDPIKQMVFFIY